MNASVTISDERFLGCASIINASVGFQIDEPFGDGWIVDIEEVIIENVTDDFGEEHDGDEVYELDLIDYFCDLVSDWLEVEAGQWIEIADAAIRRERW